jgi:hypothetical protein
MWRHGAARILDWLAGFDGGGWQERWTAASGDDMTWLKELVAADTCPRRGPVRIRDELLCGLRALIYVRAIRPRYVFFMNYRPTLIYDLARQAVETEAINRCQEAGEQLGLSGHRLNDAMKTIVRMILHTGPLWETCGRPTFSRCAKNTDMRANTFRRDRCRPGRSCAPWVC